MSPAARAMSGGVTNLVSSERGSSRSGRRMSPTDSAAARTAGDALTPSLVQIAYITPKLASTAAIEMTAGSNVRSGAASIMEESFMVSET